MKIGWATHVFHFLLKDFFFFFLSFKGTLLVGDQQTSARQWAREAEKQRQRGGLGHYHHYYSSLKYATTKTFLRQRARDRACTRGGSIVVLMCPCVSQCKSDKKKNNIIGEMYAVIIGIHKMIIHIKQGAQSQPHLHVLDYMHFKSNFRRAYEWH